jgi:hypothetical protein
MFGKSVFQSVLERLRAEEDEDAPGESAVDGSWRAPIEPSAFIIETPARTTTPFRTVESAYRELAPVEQVEQPVMPEHLKRTSLAEVAAELTFDDKETALTLAAKRRRFAAANHPDRMPAEFRANATVRMKLANMLIDEASRRLEWAGTAT